MAKNDDLDNVQRWTSGKRTALVLEILKGETSVQEAARKHGLKVRDIEDWKDRFLAGAQNALRSRPRDEEGMKDDQIKKLKQKVGELVLDIDILREGLRMRPLDRTTSDE